MKNEDEINTLKIRLVKKIMLIDTKKELWRLRDEASQSIENECDAERLDEAAFKHWKDTGGAKNESTS